MGRWILPLYYENTKLLMLGGITGLLTQEIKDEKGTFRLSLSTVWVGCFYDTKCYMTHVWEGQEANHHYPKGGVCFHQLLTHCLVCDVLSTG